MKPRSTISITTDEMGRPAPPDVMGFDELLVGRQTNVVPEPGSMALLVMGGLSYSPRAVGNTKPGTDRLSNQSDTGARL